MNRISVFYDHIAEAAAQSGLSIGKVLEKCGEYGISAVEIQYTRLKENRKTICKALDKARVSISSVYDFFDLGNDKPDKEIERAYDMLKVASELGAGKVLVVPGALNMAEAAELAACAGDYDTTAVYMDGNAVIQNMKKSLRQICEEAEKYGITVTMEDFDGFCQPFSRINELLWFMKNIPGLKYALDTGNFAFSDENVLEAMKVMKDHIVHVHCKDRAVEETVGGKYCKGMGASPVGGGYIPMGEIIQQMLNRGYDGFWAIEHFGAADQLEYIRQSAEYLIPALDG